MLHAQPLEFFPLTKLHGIVEEHTRESHTSIAKELGASLSNYLPKLSSSYSAWNTNRRNYLTVEAILYRAMDSARHSYGI